jgi:hypothetical protein
MAMLSITFDVAPDGRDPFRVVAASRDISAWEREVKGRRFTDGASIAQFEEIARIASVRHGLWHGTIQEFRATCDIDVVLPEDDEEPDPTQPAP